MCRYYIIFLQFMEELFTKWCAVIGPCGVIPQCHKTVALNCNNIQKRRWMDGKYEKIMCWQQCPVKTYEGSILCLLQNLDKFNKSWWLFHEKGSRSIRCGPNDWPKWQRGRCSLVPSPPLSTGNCHPPPCPPWQRHKKSPDLEESLIVQGRDKDKGKDGSISRWKNHSPGRAI